MALRSPELWRDALAIGVCVAGLIVIALSVPGLVHGRGWGFDFGAYYQAAERLAETGTPYQTLTLGGPFIPGPEGLYLYSPLPALLVLPMTALDLATATDLFFVVRIGLLIATSLLMPVPWRLRLAITGVGGLSLAVLADLALGNVSLIVTFLTVIAWRFIDRPQGSLAIAASLFVRPMMGLFLGWWLIRGRMRPLAWAIAGATGVTALSVLLIGLGPYFDYLVVLRNLSEVTATVRNLAPAALAFQLGAPPMLEFAVLVGTYAVSVSAVLLSLRRDRELSFVVVAMATILVSPLLWDHYLIQLLIPAAFLAARGRWWGMLLPLLSWSELAGLPAAMPAAVVIGTLLPFLAHDRGEPAGTTLDRLPTRQAAAPV